MTLFSDSNASLCVPNVCFNVPKSEKRGFHILKWVYFTYFEDGQFKQSPRLQRERDHETKAVLRGKRTHIAAAVR